MNEEKFNPNVADADTMLIVARLGERKRKLERMAEMEHRLARRTTKKKSSGSSGIAYTRVSTIVAYANIAFGQNRHIAAYVQRLS